MSDTAPSDLGPCPPRIPIEDAHNASVHWCSLAYADWQRKRAERAEALLREALEALIADDHMFFDDLDRRIAAHLAEVGDSSGDS